MSQSVDIELVNDDVMVMKQNYYRNPMGSSQPEAHFFPQQSRRKEEDADLMTISASFI